MKIICIGDSHTYGYGLTRRENWVSLLQQKYGLECVNKGINGDTTGGMLARFQRDVVDVRADMVMLMGGTNDFIAGCGLGTVKANIMAMVHQAYYHGMTPVVGIPVKIVPRQMRDDWAGLTEPDEVNAGLSAYREWLLRFSSRLRILYVDFWGDFFKRTGAGYDSYVTDGLHLCAAGHEILAEIVYRHMVTWKFVSPP